MGEKKRFEQSVYFAHKALCAISAIIRMSSPTPANVSCLQKQINIVHVSLLKTLVRFLVELVSGCAFPTVELIIIRQV